MVIEPLMLLAAGIAASQGAPASEARPAPPSMILDYSYNAFVAVEESPALKDIVYPAIYTKPGGKRPGNARKGVSPIS